MTSYHLVVAREVRSLITHLPPQLKGRIKEALRSISKDPFQAKKLKDELEGLQSYRVGKTRILYQIRNHIIEIVAFGPREEIYQRAAVELRAILDEKPKD